MGPFAQPLPARKSRRAGGSSSVEPELLVDGTADNASGAPVDERAAEGWSVGFSFPQPHSSMIPMQLMHPNGRSDGMASDDTAGHKGGKNGEGVMTCDLVW